MLVTVTLKMLGLLIMAVPGPVSATLVAVGAHPVTEGGVTEVDEAAGVLVVAAGLFVGGVGVALAGPVADGCGLPDVVAEGVAEEPVVAALTDALGVSPGAASEGG